MLLATSLIECTQTPFWGNKNLNSIVILMCLLIDIYIYLCVIQNIGYCVSSDQKQ